MIPARSAGPSDGESPSLHGQSVVRPRSVADAARDGIREPADAPETAAMMFGWLTLTT